MSELRFDPLTEQYVVIAPDRLKRPHAFKSEGELSESFENPFAVGNESKTPGEVYASREAGTRRDTPGWTVRVFPNLYPAFEEKSELNGERHPLYESMTAFGGHEVIVETAEEKVPLEKLTVSDRVLYLEAAQHRFNYWKTVSGIQSTYLFKNSGRVAGASLSHAHSQFIALPVIPPRFKKRNDYLKRYFKQNQSSYFEVLVRSEIQAESRVVWESNEIIAFCPYVSRFPYEVVIYPKNALPDFGVVSASGLGEISEALGSIFKGIEGATGRDFPYNLFLQQIPVRESGEEWFRWSIEIYPRVGGIAGFEMGTGMWINSVEPEKAAKRIRSGQ